MAISPLAGKPAPRDMLVYAHTPDLDNAAERVSFGTSGHRGSSLRGSFTEAHILAITQAICDYRRGQGIDGPLHMGKDTHALSRPAERTALEVLAANERDHDRPARRRCDADAGHLPRHPRRKPRPPHRARRRHRRHAVAQPAATRSCARLRRSSTDHSDRDPMLKRVVVMLATVVAGLLAPTMAATQTPMTDPQSQFRFALEEAQSHRGRGIEGYVTFP